LNLTVQKYDAEEGIKNYKMQLE